MCADPKADFQTAEGYFQRTPDPRDHRDADGGVLHDRRRPRRLRALHPGVLLALQTLRVDVPEAPAPARDVDQHETVASSVETRCAGRRNAVDATPKRLVGGDRSCATRRRRRRRSGCGLEEEEAAAAEAERVRLGGGGRRRESGRRMSTGAWSAGKSRRFGGALCEAKTQAGEGGARGGVRGEGGAAPAQDRGARGTDQGVMKNRETFVELGRGGLSPPSSPGESQDKFSKSSSAFPSASAISSATSGKARPPARSRRGENSSEASGAWSSPKTSSMRQNVADEVHLSTRGVEGSNRLRTVRMSCDVFRFHGSIISPKRRPSKTASRSANSAAHPTRCKARHVRHHTAAAPFSRNRVRDASGG